MVSGPFQAVDKVYYCDLCCKSLAEFRRPQTAEKSQNRVFRRHVRRKTLCSGRKCVPQKGTRAAACIPSKKCLHF